MKSLVCAALLSLFPALSSAEPMWFKSVSNGGNCAGCGWTIAEGEITSDTPDVFRAIVDGDDFYSREIVFNSPGGNLGAALELGRIIRERGLATGIGRAVPMPGTPWYEMTEGGACNSACAFAFFAGGARAAYQDENEGFAPRQGTLGMHQFYTPTGQEIPSAQTQQIMGQVLLYVLEMGINAEVLSIASRTPASDMYVFDREELAELDLLTTAKTLPVDLVVDDAGALAALWRVFSPDGKPERDVQLSCRGGNWHVRTTQHQRGGATLVGLDLLRTNGVQFSVGDETHSISGNDVLSYAGDGAAHVLEVRLPTDPTQYPGQVLNLYPFSGRNFWMENAATEPLPDAPTLAILKRACLP